MKKISAIVEILIIVLVTIWVLVGCTAKNHIYKVTFEDGTYDYYELTYKLTKGATAIDYDGETIIGVKEFEEVK